ncbi:hypothetical protein ACFQPF_02630 [Fictibacillus iocasae]|uniref:DUF4083 domain-containing protein n=1 Tax=Fictibacillus iocasae TaxID=2715437 RepID=A0ABW2NN00_9BACL
MLEIVFPENKLEYIPAFITLAIFTYFAYRTVLFFQKHHNKEIKKAEALEQELKTASWNEKPSSR